MACPKRADVALEPVAMTSLDRHRGSQKPEYPRVGQQTNIGVTASLNANKTKIN